MIFNTTKGEVKMKKYLLMFFTMFILMVFIPITVSAADSPGYNNQYTTVDYGDVVSSGPYTQEVPHYNQLQCPTGLVDTVLHRFMQSGCSVEVPIVSVLTLVTGGAVNTNYRYNLFYSG